MVHFILYMLLALGVAAADQFSKYKMLEFFSHRAPPVYVTDFFNLVAVSNKGISFGLFNGEGHIGPLVLTIFTSLIVACLIVMLWRSRGRLQSWALSLIIGGALGNIVDRLDRGSVVDFLDFHAFGHHWPAFNVADSAVVCGVILLLVQGLVFDKKTRQH